MATGEVVYDPDAVNSALAALSDPAVRCEDFYIDLGWTLRDLLTFGGILTGTAGEGSACSPRAGQKGGTFSCQPGLICHGDDEATAICKRAALENEPCDVNGTTSLCIDDRPPDSDNEFESTFDALVCIPDGAGASMGISSRVPARGCAARPSIGQQVRPASTISSVRATSARTDAASSDSADASCEHCPGDEKDLPVVHRR